MWLGNAVTSSTLHADPPSNETIDVFYIKRGIRGCNFEGRGRYLLSQQNKFPKFRKLMAPPGVKISCDLLTA